MMQSLVAWDEMISMKNKQPYCFDGTKLFYPSCRPSIVLVLICDVSEKTELILITLFDKWCRPNE